LYEYFYFVSIGKLTFNPAKLRGNVCGGVCNTTTFESLDPESSFLVCGYHHQRMQVKLIYQGHEVKVKVTGL